MTFPDPTPPSPEALGPQEHQHDPLGHCLIQYCAVDLADLVAQRNKLSDECQRLRNELVLIKSMPKVLTDKKIADLQAKLSEAEKDVVHWKNIVLQLEKERDAAREGLRCYALNFPCPGFEVGMGAGETSGCTGQGGDCPTCETLDAALKGTP